MGARRGGAQDYAPGTGAGYYPPALTGMRGSHDGSFEVVACAARRRVRRPSAAASDTGETYDLVVVGGGISGLAAAYFYRANVGRGAQS